MPVTSAALLIALGLVPGYLFLRLTGDIRRPGGGSTVTELLEVVFVGVFTTGVVVAIFFGSAPGTAQATVAALRDVGRAEPSDLRHAVGWSALVYGISFILAGFLAWLVRRRVSSRAFRYSPTVLEAAFNDVPDGHYGYAQVTLKSGETVEGVLRAYSDSDDAERRVIALKRPIVLWKVGSTKPTRLGVDRKVIMGAEIASIGFIHHPKPLADGD